MYKSKNSSLNIKQKIKNATGLKPRTTQFVNEQMVECSFTN